MKFSLYLISAFILISCVSAHNYHNHNRPDNHNSNLPFGDLESDLVYFGIDFIFQKAADKYGVADSNVQVTLINDFGIRNLNNDWAVYWFNVDATNNNDATVEARFGVKYNHETGEKNIGRWSYHIHYYDNNNNSNSNSNEETELEGLLNEEQNEFVLDNGQGEEGAGASNNTDYEDVPQDQIQSDPVINAALLAGADSIFADAAANFGLSENGIQIANVESLQQRNAGANHTHYRAHVQAENDDGALVDARFIVDLNNQTQDMLVVGHWSYHILNYGNPNEEAGNFEEEVILDIILDFGLSSSN